MTVFQSRRKDTEVLSTNGVYIETATGRYLDAISGIFNVPFGYSCNRIKQAINDALVKAPFHPKEHFYTDITIDTAKKLLALAQMPGGSALYVNSGSEAIEAALALALEYHKRRGNPGKKRFLARRHSYHGASLGASSVTGRNNFKDLKAAGYETIKVDPPFQVTHQKIVSQPFTIEQLTQLIAEEGSETIAGIIFEPINHLKGMHQTPPEYIQGVRKLCDQHDILMITDEIVTGAYRTGSFLHTHQHGVTPDIVALGKGISGGYYPVSAMLAVSKIANIFSSTNEWVPFSYSHTYAGNPVAISVVAAAIEELEQAHQSGHLQVLAAALKEHEKKLSSHPRVVRTNSAGLVFGMTIAAELGEDTGRRMEQLCHDQQVVIRGEEDWICVVPAYITSTQELDKVFEVIHASLNSL